MIKQIPTGKFVLPGRKLAFVIKNQEKPLSVMQNNYKLKIIDKQNYLKEKGYYYDNDDKAIYISLGMDVYNADTNIKIITNSTLLK